MTSYLSELTDDGLGTAMDSYLFGCELSSKTNHYTFKVDEEEDDDFSLSLCTISLGEGAKDEYNVVEVTARNHNDEDITVPIATLKLSCQTMVNLESFVIQPPVTFRLKSGSGPIQLSGQVLIAPTDLDSDEEEDDEEDDDEDDSEEAELTPVKPANKKIRK
ncbi:nucleoplasmin-3 [Bufo gargarizans]|uniref:nucleoplasmin-3 n=1 Tax=Bufo gargarizans TaxID=30331 RepID=UPI001CF43D08|nr:nucleoplasmin-3 [Bufo gargarizans]